MLHRTQLVDVLLAKKGFIPMKRSMFGLIGVALMLTMGCQMPDQKLKQQMIGKPAPDFELSALDGKKVRLSSYRGKPVFLTFWGHG